ncbi:MAG: conjugal transfer protein [Solirubrobacteraceae bacterium]
MSARASVTVTTRPIWRIRLGRGVGRYVVYALALWGMAASARYAIDPPRPVLPAAPHVQPPVRAAEGFAALFIRRYLTWNAASPETYRRELEPFIGQGGISVLGTQLPNKGEQQVQWDEVVQTREPQPGEHVYTVAAQTDTAGLLYLTVSVVRQADGNLALAGYPAFVGAPDSSSIDDLTEGLKDVEEPPLETVVRRALSNYLDGSSSELASDLTSQAHVSLPGLALQLQSVSALKWEASHHSVFALVVASDQRGAQYTLTYELDVSRVQGRWEISAIQMNPNTDT